MGLLSGIKDTLFGRDVSTKNVNTLTPAQQMLLNQFSGLSAQYAPSTYGYISRVMGGDTGFTPEAIEQFYQGGVLQPALQEWETYTRPALEEQYGNRYHSSARTKTLSRAFSDLMSNMGQTRANLQYQGLQQNLQARMQAAQMMQNQLGMPLGVKGTELIATQQPSMFDIFTSGGTTAIQGLVGLKLLGG